MAEIKQSSNQEQPNTPDMAMRNVSTRFPDALYKRLGKAAIDADTTIQDALIEATEEWLAVHDQARVGKDKK